MFNVPAQIWFMIGLLVAVHLILDLAGENFTAWATCYLAFIPSRFASGLQRMAECAAGKYPSFVTYGLLHADLGHLFANSVWMLVFGTPVARRLPPLKFWLLAAAGSLGGALATWFLHWNEYLILIGASATVSAFVAAATPIMFGAGSMLARVDSDEAVRRAHILSLPALLRHPAAMVFMVMFLLLTLSTGAAQIITGTALLGEHQIAWEAHLGGFVAGLLTFYVIDRPLAPKSL